MMVRDGCSKAGNGRKGEGLLSAECWMLIADGRDRGENGRGCHYDER